MENFFSLSIRNIFFEFSRNDGFIMVLLIEMRYYKKKKKLDNLFRNSSC